MMNSTQGKAIGHTIWFKVILTILIFLPSITQTPYNPADTSKVIAAVMAHPLISSIPVLLPVAKLLLLCAGILPLIYKKNARNLVLGYYGAILVITGVFQNIANTESYGYVWLIGNTFVQICVAFYCFYDVSHKKSVISKENVNKKRLWILIPMLFAFFMPYSIDSQGFIQPSFPVSALWNEAGVTYCMITPVIIGILIIFSKGVYKPLLSVISYVGLLFGLLNMITWFIMQNRNWWMGALHLPLLILSLYGLLVFRAKASSAGA